MARHNREGKGSDQRGCEYDVSYQPDWLQQVKVTRNLESGRQSTKTLFRNPAAKAEQKHGGKVRTRVVCAEEGIDFEIAISDPNGVIVRVTVETQPRRPAGRAAARAAIDAAAEEMIAFTFEDRMPPPNDE
jgi:hypothetical protein